MAHYESPEELPDDIDAVKEGDTVDVNNTTFVMHVATEFKLSMLREMLEGAIKALQQALDAFDNYAKTDSEHVNVLLNVMDSMHTWTHTNREPLMEWALGAAERDTVAEAAEILKSLGSEQ